MEIDTQRLVCAIRPYGEAQSRSLFGNIMFRMPCYTGKISFVMPAEEYYRFVIYPLQTLADFYGKKCREQIGNTGGNFFFDFKLWPNGQVFCRYELSNEDRFDPNRSTIFRGSFSTDHLHLGKWLTQAHEDLKKWIAPPDLCLIPGGLKDQEETTH